MYFYNDIELGKSYKFPTTWSQRYYAGGSTYDTKHWGKVIYIDPKLRWFLVDFGNGIRESFQMVANRNLASRVQGTPDFQKYADYND